MIGRLHWLWILLAVMVMVPPARAQSVSSSSDSSAQSATPMTSVAGASESSSTPQLQPDTQPLAGAYLFTLGSIFGGHNYFQPVLSVAEAGQTNAEEFLPGSNKSLELATMPSVDLSLVHVSSTNELFVSYLGGGIIYNNLLSESTSFHMADLRDSIQFRHLILSFSDSFSYLPNASYGFGGLGLPAGAAAGYMGGFGFSGGLGQINPAFASGQSILTNEYSAFNNTALVQAAYQATGRTSLTFGGIYGTLQGGSHGTGFINGNNIYGMAGLSHALTARDTIGVTYTYGTFHYVGLPESFKVQMAQLSYGRKVTGRLSLQLYGGPELMAYTVLGHPARSRIYGSGMGALSYLQGRNTFSLFGGRYATGGSGVLAGSETTTISAGWRRSLTRRWSGAVYSGYSRNSVLPVAMTQTGQHYAYWIGNMTANRALSRRVSFYISYEYEHQINNAGPCGASVCAVNGDRQLFGVGITFTPRPFGL